MQHLLQMEIWVIFGIRANHNLMKCSIFDRTLGAGYIICCTNEYFTSQKYEHTYPFFRSKHKPNKKNKISTGFQHFRLNLELIFISLLLQKNIPLKTEQLFTTKADTS